MKKIVSSIFYLIIFLHLIPSAELLSDNKVISVLGMGNLNCIAYSPDGNHFASAGDLGKIYIWDLKTIYLIDTIQTNGMKSIAYSPDGTKIAVGSVGGETFIYDVTSGDELHVF